ncbi:MAG: hypothetical protein GXY82_09235 [Methanospirillum sp.]|nr:hypothetical protein [Methanospirillum sp.]
MCVLVAPITYTENAASVAVSVRIGSTTYSTEIQTVSIDIEPVLKQALEIVLEQVLRDYPRAYLSRPSTLVVI